MNLDNMHAPHYTSTIYQLTLLSDLGVKADDQRIGRGVEAVLKTQRDDGGFPGHNPKQCEYGPFDIGQIIHFMYQFGLGDDPRLERMYEWIEKNQTLEGGWVGVRVKCHPTEGGCRLGTTSVLQGLASSGKFVSTRVAEKGLEFLAQVMASESLYSRRTSYPNLHRIDDIKLAEICLGLGIGADEEPLKRYLANILVLQEDDGWWLEQRVPYPPNSHHCKRMGRLFPRKDKPSKWITEKAMAVLKKASSSRYTLWRR